MAKRPNSPAACVLSVWWSPRGGGSWERDLFGKNGQRRFLVAVRWDLSSDRFYAGRKRSECRAAVRKVRDRRRCEKWHALVRMTVSRWHTNWCNSHGWATREKRFACVMRARCSVLFYRSREGNKTRQNKPLSAVIPQATLHTSSQEEHWNKLRTKTVNS